MNHGLKTRDIWGRFLIAAVAASILDAIFEFARVFVWESTISTGNSALSWLALLLVGVKIPLIFLIGVGTYIIATYYQKKRWKPIVVAITLSVVASSIASLVMFVEGIVGIYARMMLPFFVFLNIILVIFDSWYKLTLFFDLGAIVIADAFTYLIIVFFALVFPNDSILSALVIAASLFDAILYFKVHDVIVHHHSKRIARAGAASIPSRRNGRHKKV